MAGPRLGYLCWHAISLVELLGGGKRSSLVDKRSNGGNAWFIVRLFSDDQCYGIVKSYEEPNRRPFVSSKRVTRGNLRDEMLEMAD